ncbi:uncharacterized protein G2W53_014444 [Senna tora]|uniref:Uncharacterized protein n=1 Tax=Senna tora TaxID=362788 RepID=A0A835C6F2_9FABA|nr:uncharacterized protein G2W53_014444 [Senna tora]
MRIPVKLEINRTKRTSNQTRTNCPENGGTLSYLPS